MNVLLVSQCNKRALTESRRILDQFAERRGECTWQTAITQAGLETLRKLLRKTARKNTAVACHWIRGKDHSELLWVVGDTRQFNSRGATPTNTTERDVLRARDEDDWHSAEDIRLLASLAALFHDFGKATLAFQNKLKKNQAIADPYRHEWISLRLFEAFVAGQTDEQWLQRLTEIDTNATKACIGQLKCDGLASHRGPFATLPLLAKAVGWLIVSHHRMPGPTGAFNANQQLARLPEEIGRSWCGERKDVTPAELKQCWDMKKGLPFDSLHWCAHAKTLAQKMLQRAGLLGTDWCDNAYAMHTARLALMLADHYYSSQPSHRRYGDRTFKLFANTDRQTRALKQRLDEHLIGVEVNASRIVRTLPQLTESLPSVARHKGFRQRSADRRFAWQDRAFDLAEGLQDKSAAQGFFGVNMASTGCGKTLANGRIMYALANPAKGARFSIALGLRTLTLQTGEAYRHKLNLGDEDLAVMVGGAAVKELHEIKLKNGSESGAPLLPEWQHVHFEGSMVDGPLSRWLKESPAAHRLLDAPVLTCTVDHLMPATEGTRGGHQIAPMLRLMSSDLVLDEPDDFGLEDLPALARLVNWAGMLGSRVLLSSATLPPALIQGLFDAYLAGRRQYQRNRGTPGQQLPVCCAWFDEFIPLAGQHADADSFMKQHQSFVEKRLAKLGTKQADSRRKALIKPLDIAPGLPESELFQAFATHLSEQIAELHQIHSEDDPISDKKLSIGLVRMANIRPLVGVAKALFATAPPPDTRIHLCVYHSQHPLLVRSAIEGQLDSLLTRHRREEWLASEPVRQLLDTYPEANQIVVVLATPVAEVGRDHDYDWGIVEPSSMRSIIQLAGRIRRHRQGSVQVPNLYLLDTNLRHLRSGMAAPAYLRPGFESPEFRLRSHALSQLLTAEQWQRIDASSRIQSRVEPDPSGNLVDLEHEVTRQWVQGAGPGEALTVLPASLWWQYRAPLCSALQHEQPFRYDPLGRQRYVLMPDEADPHLHRVEKDGQLVGVNNLKTDIGLELAQGICPWGMTDYLTELESLAKQLNMTLEDTARRYGFLDLPAKGCDNGWEYHPALGFNRIG